MNEDLMSLNSIAESLDELVNQVMKYGKPSSQIVKKVFTRSGQVDGGEKNFEPRLWVEVFFVPYPLGVYLLKKASELYEDDPDATYEVELLDTVHEWRAQEIALVKYQTVKAELERRVQDANSKPYPEPTIDHSAF